MAVVLEYLLTGDDEKWTMCDFTGQLGYVFTSGSLIAVKLS
jgi:hypothetical protein